MKTKVIQYILFTLAGILVTGLIGYTITFDSDLIPGADNIYSIGTSLQRFTNLFISNDAVIEGRVGIGTTTLNNALQVAGNVAIGFSSVAPPNSLIVAGKVGIGTTSPTNSLEVVGNALISSGQLRLGNFSSNPTAIGEGSVYYNNTDKNPYYYDGTIWKKLSGGSATVDSA